MLGKIQRPSEAVSTSIDSYMGFGIKKAGAIEVDNFTMLNAKLDALIKRMDKVNVNAISTLSSSCELC